MIYITRTGERDVHVFLGGAVMACTPTEARQQRTNKAAKQRAHRAAVTRTPRINLAVREAKASRDSAWWRREDPAVRASPTLHHSPREYTAMFSPLVSAR